MQKVCSQPLTTGIEFSRLYSLEIQNLSREEGFFNFLTTHDIATCLQRFRPSRCCKPGLERAQNATGGALLLQEGWSGEQQRQTGGEASCQTWMLKMRNDLDELKKSQKKEGHFIVLAILNSSKETNMQRSLPNMRQPSLVLHQANGVITSCPSASSQMTIPGTYPNVLLWRAGKSKGLDIDPRSYCHLTHVFCSLLFISPPPPAE